MALLRLCRRCKEMKLPDAFYMKRDGRGNPRPDSTCKTCVLARIKKYREANPEQTKARKKRWYQERGRFVTRDLAYRRTYNSTQEAYDVQFQAQDEKCAICRRPQAEGERNFAFDHDHQTGLTRGVLCSACNGGLGCFRDNPTALRTAIAYLAAWAEIHADSQKQVG